MMIGHDGHSWSGGVCISGGGIGSIAVGIEDEKDGSMVGSGRRIVGAAIEDARAAIASNKDMCLLQVLKKYCTKVREFCCNGILHREPE